MIVSEHGSAKAWVIAFVLMTGLGLGAFIGIGCLVGANTCPGSSGTKQTSTSGEELFVRNCALCHGLDGKGIRGVPSLVSGTIAAYPVEELVPRITKGKPLGGMPRFRGVLTEAQIRAVAEHVVTKRAGG